MTDQLKRGSAAFIAASAEAAMPVATVRVKHGGYGMELSTYVAYALPEGMHDLYAKPQASQPIGQTAEDYLRSKYGAYRGHFAWRALEEAFNAGKASNSQPVSGAEMTEAELHAKACDIYDSLRDGPSFEMVCFDGTPNMVGAIKAALLSASGQASQSEKAEVKVGRVRNGYGEWVSQTSQSEKASTPSDIDLLIALTALHEISWSNDSQWQSDRAKAAIRAFSSTPAQQTDKQKTESKYWVRQCAYKGFVIVDPGFKDVLVVGENEHLANSIAEFCNKKFAAQQTEEKKLWSCDMSPPQGFIDYVSKNYSGEVVFSDPAWHALRLWNAAMRNAKPPFVQAPVNVPDDWRKFVTDCSKTAGGMVSGNHLSILAGRLLAAAPAPVDQTEAQQSEKDAIQVMLALHARMLETNPYCYFELAYTRYTGWMAWLCTNSREHDENRKVIAKGQGDTPDDACRDALSAIAKEQAK